VAFRAINPVWDEISQKAYVKSYFRKYDDQPAMTLIHVGTEGARGSNAIGCRLKLLKAEA